MSPAAVSLAGVPVIRTERLVLRGLEARDLAPYAAYRASPRNARAGGPMGADEAAERFAAMAGHWLVHGFGRWAFCEAEDGPGIGHVGPSALDPPTTQMTWTLWSAEHEGRGYATEAARAALAHLAGRWPELPAHVRPDNAPSRRVAERLGGAIDADAPSPPWMPEGLTYRLSVAA